MNDVSLDKAPPWAQTLYVIGNSFPATVPAFLAAVLAAIVALALWACGVSGSAILPWCLFAAALVVCHWIHGNYREVRRESNGHLNEWVAVVAERNALQRRYEGDPISPYRKGRARVVRFNDKLGKRYLDPEIDAFLSLRPPSGSMAA